MEGPLKLYQGMLGLYKERYCILHNEVFTICNKKGGDVRGRLHPGAYSIKSDNQKLLLLLSNGITSLEFKAESLGILIAWNNKLKEVKQDFLERTIRTEGVNNLSDEDEDIKVADSFEGLRSDTVSFKLKERLAQVWCTQANLTEAMNDLFHKIPKHAVYAQAVSQIDALGKDLKVIF